MSVPIGEIVEFVEGNYGYTSNAVTYQARKVSGRWGSTFVGSSFSD